MSSVGGLRFDPALNRTMVTLPSESLCHYITDDELERLAEMRKEPVMEICLTAVGALLGSLIPAAQAFSEALNHPEKIGAVSLLTMAIAVAALSVSVVSGILWRQRGKTHHSMVQTIRARPRVAVNV